MIYSDHLTVTDMSGITIFKHAIVVTMDTKRSILEDGAVVVEADRILAVGSTDSITKKYKSDREIDAKKKVILPGLVSLHFHSDNFSRGVGEHMGLEEWLNKLYYPMLQAMTPDDAYAAAMLAYAEALKSGSTTVNDMYRHIPACADAAEKIGIRAVLSSEAADLIEGQETLADNEKAVVAKNNAANGRIKVWFGAEWVPVCSPEFFEKTRELANKYKVGIHVHLNESIGEVELCKKKFGQRPVEHVYNLGLLGRDVVAAHCVWLSDKEIKIFEEDYLDLKEREKVLRYRTALIREGGGKGVYSPQVRGNIINIVAGNVGEIDMSKDKIQVSGVAGPVNIKSQLDRVTQIVKQAPAMPDEKKREFTQLVAELREALKAAAETRPDDSERIVRTAELVATEVAKDKPDKGFLNITVEGLKQAAKAVEDIAPAVIGVAAKVARFVAGLQG